MAARANPIQGRRVLVTRAEPARGPLCSALAARGARVFHWPAYRIVTQRGPGRRDWARRLARCDWLVFASAHAVQAVSAWGAPASLRDGPRPRVAVVGAATAAAARAAGWRVALRPAQAHAAALAAALAARGVAGRRIALPASREARGELAARLRAAGARVERVVAYRLEWPRRSPRRLRRACKRGFDALTFTSPSTVEGLARGLGPAALRRLLAQAPSVAIGATTRAALARRTPRAVRVAPDASIAALVRAVHVSLAESTPAPGGRA
jgi:uroporphyrinogen-III synthase